MKNIPDGSIKERLVGCFTIIEKYFNYNQGFLYNLNMTIKTCRNFCSKHIYLWLKRGYKHHFIQHKLSVF